MKKNYFLFFLLSFKLLAQNPELDPTFNVKDTGIYQQNIGYDAVVLPDNKILTVFESGSRYNAMLLNPDGSPVRTFNTTDSYSVNEIQIIAKSDGAFITLAYGGIVRAFNANGTLNSVFPTTTLKNVNSNPVQVKNIIYQDDGKLIINGAFDMTNDVYTGGMIRLNPDGSLDSTFKLESGGNKLILLSDGKSVTTSRTTIYRYLATGKNDPSFKVKTTIDPVQKYVTNGFETDNNSLIEDIVVQPDGKIIAVGCNFVENGKTFSYQIVRLNSDGTRDTSFKKFDSQTPNLTRVYLQSDNKIILLAKSGPALIRLNTDGTTDTTFNYSNSAPLFYTEGKLFFQGNKIIVTGNYKNNDGITRSRIHRINADGSFDFTFNPHSGPNLFFDEQNSKTSYPFTAKTLLDQKILLAGDFSTYNDKPARNICRITQSGEFDPTFTLDPTVKINAEISQSDYTIIPQNDGKIILLHNGGISANGKGTSIIRLNNDGSIDNSFNFSPKDNTFDNIGTAVIKDIKILNNGKFLIIGESGLFTKKIGNYYSYNVIQLNSDGSLDTNYKASFFHKPIKITTLSDNKVLISFLQNTYDYTYFPVLKLNENGTTDSSFKSGNLFLHRIKELSDGKILAINNNLLLTRLNSDGSTDPSFTSYSFAKGNFNKFNYYENGEINLFLTSSSTKKLTFSSEGTLLNTVDYNTTNDFEIQNCEDVLFYGYITNIGDVNKNAIVRYKTSNTPSNPNPAGEVFQPFTNGQTLADLKIEGTNINWYAVQSACGINNTITKKGTNLPETVLPPSTLLVNGMTYYASQTINGTESSYRLPVTAYSATLDTKKHELPNLVTYPNPVKDFYTISNSEEITKVEVYNLAGQLLLSNTYSNNNLKIDFTSLTSGLYFVKIHAHDKVAVIKTMKI